MEAAPSISVIIPTRNRLKFLQESVASVLAQSFRDWELIVVDDASEDGTWAWLRSIDDGRIRVLRLDQHRERSAARNAGFRASRGEFVLFLDDDDWLLDGALARLFQALRRKPEAIGTIGAVTYRKENGHSTRTPHPRRCVLDDIWKDMLFGWVPLLGQALFRRSNFIEAGGWRERMSLSEDYELFLRVSSLGPMVLIPQAVLAYRIHAGQTEKTAARGLSLRLRQQAIARLSGEKRRRAEQWLRAGRLVGVARHAYRDASLRRAAACAWQAIGCAPEVLGSPITRRLMLPFALRCSAGSIVGWRGVRFWRRCRKAVTERVRASLQRRGLSAQPEEK
jgi:glycosyltransferase involved in cell wall biosynthesis